MNKIIQLSFLSLIVFSSDCFAMDQLTNEELCSYFDKLFISSHQPLQLTLEPDFQSSSSQEDFTQATPWQTQSFLDFEAEKENTPPHNKSLFPKNNPKKQVKNSHVHTQINKKAERRTAAQSVDLYLASHQEITNNAHPLRTRGKTFYIPLKED